MSNFLKDNIELMKEYNYNKNKCLDLNNLTLGSDKKIWWICSNNHEWESNIYNRSHGKNGCPICSNRIVLEGFNDLNTKFPDVAKQWNYEKNGDLKPTQVTYGSGKKVWWKCDKGHEWITSINNRTMGKNCPNCAKDTQTSFPEQSIYYYCKKVFKDVFNRYKDKYEIDIFIKDINVGIEYDGRFFHSNSKSEKTEKKKEEYFKNKGITIYRVKENNKQCIKEKNDFYLYYDYDNGKNLTDVLKKLFDILSIKNVDIDITRDYMEIQEQYISSIKENSIFVIKPTLCEEWNYIKNKNITPDMISYSSAKKVWWTCPICKNDYTASVYSRYNGTACPYCTNRILISGKNDLATTNPELLKEWDYTKNRVLPNEVFAGGREKVWWKCAKKHSYQKRLIDKRNGGKCPICCNQKVLKGYNDLKTTNPNLAKEWNYNKNIDLLPTEITAGSKKKVWWQCSKCGHEWQAQVANRKNGTGCPLCK